MRIANFISLLVPFLLLAALAAAVVLMPRFSAARTVHTVVSAGSGASVAAAAIRPAAITATSGVLRQPTVSACTGLSPLALILPYRIGNGF